MRSKKIRASKVISLILVLIGIVLFALGMYARHRIGGIKKAVQATSGIFSNNPVDKGIEKAIEGKIDSYNTPIFFTVVGGVVFVVVGVGLFFYARKR